MTNAAEVARRIVQDLKTGAPFNGYGTTPARSVAQAYEIQDIVTSGFLDAGDLGAVGGWKIAANSAALMERFKLDEPATGRVFSAQCHNDTASLRADDYIEFAFEPEIAALIKTTLDPADAPFSAEVVASAIDGFVAGIELLDMRKTDMPNTHIPDAIAQNISNVGAVCGTGGVAPDQLDAGTVHTVVTIDGDVRHDVTGGAPQDPLAAVTWIANHLAARGLTLAAGHVVLCGTHSPILFKQGAGEIVVEMSGLGKVTVNLTA
ncbi:2-keto-4-pentenoate hydratase [Sulfitobacter geojensis]|uniref:2-keto-4-pentenoate hydratase n=1 Tax=Sulfitobacter geojensis TaxID=1342299 RepID=UPI0036D7FFC1